MKVGVVFFHKNINQIYSQEWIYKCINSVKNQSFKDFIIYEINYGGDNLRLVDNSVFYNIEKINYADAMNFIFTEAFSDGCDFVFNTNLDDFYSLKRVEKQLKYLKMGFDVVSSDFCYVDEFDNITNYMNITKYGNIKLNLNNNHNVIAHPCVGVSKNFWNDKSNRYDIEKIPEEDLDLWKRSINNGYKFYILEDILLYYRIHNNRESNKKNK